MMCNGIEMTRSLRTMMQSNPKAQVSRLGGK